MDETHHLPQPEKRRPIRIITFRMTDELYNAINQRSHDLRLSMNKYLERIAKADLLVADKEWSDLESKVREEANGAN